MKCYIVRHGRTGGNEERRFSGGRTDDVLTSGGAGELEAQPRPDGRTVIVRSPMKRAEQTAEILFPWETSVAIDDLREMDLGKFEGKNHEELDGDPDYQDWIDSGGTIRIPGGESMASFGDRTMRGLRKAYEYAAGQDADNLIVVAHGGTAMAVMSLLFGGNYYDYLAANGEGYVFEMEVDDAGNLTAAGTYDSFCGRIRS